MRKIDIVLDRYIVLVKNACASKSIIIPGNAKVDFILEKYGYLYVCKKGTAKKSIPTINGAYCIIMPVFNLSLFFFSSTGNSVPKK